MSAATTSEALTDEAARAIIEGAYCTLADVRRRLPVLLKHLGAASVVSVGDVQQVCIEASAEIDAALAEARVDPRKLPLIDMTAYAERGPNNAEYLLMPSSGERLRSIASVLAMARLLRSEAAVLAGAAAILDDIEMRGEKELARLRTAPRSVVKPSAILAREATIIGGDA
jgi:hypothetical protein